MGYYTPCKEFDECNYLITAYFEKGQYEACFQGHLRLAKQGYPLAECQVGHFYYEGLGVAKDLEKAFMWTKRAAEHGDRDAQFNLAEFYLNGIVAEKDFEAAKRWYIEAARQGDDSAVAQCKALGIVLPS